jgi:hypothetical protein
MPVTTTVLSCSQCPNGRYRLQDNARPDLASCDNPGCDNVVSLADDIRPHLDANELTTVHAWSEGGLIIRRVAVIRTDACEVCGTISSAHFDVRVGDSLPAVLQSCPNDPRT